MPRADVVIPVPDRQRPPVEPRARRNGSTCSSPTAKGLRTPSPWPEYRGFLLEEGRERDAGGRAVAAPPLLAGGASPYRRRSEPPGTPEVPCMAPALAPNASPALARRAAGPEAEVLELTPAAQQESDVAEVDQQVWERQAPIRHFDLAPCAAAPNAAAPSAGGAAAAGGAWARHIAGRCRPCAWFWKPKGCLNAQDCDYCHWCPEGELKKRKKVKVTAMRLGALAPWSSRSGHGGARRLRLAPFLLGGA